MRVMRAQVVYGPRALKVANVVVEVVIVVVVVVVSVIGISSILVDIAFLGDWCRAFLQKFILNLQAALAHEQILV